MTTTYDVDDEIEIMQLGTKLRYSWIGMFYYIITFFDLISDIVVTGIGF